MLQAKINVLQFQSICNKAKHKIQTEPQYQNITCDSFLKQFLRESPTCCVDVNRSENENILN